MKTTALVFTTAALFAGSASADLLAWWSFNNTNNDSDLTNANGDDNTRNNFGHMLDANTPFDDGFYDDTAGILYPVYDNSSIDPGALVDATAFQDQSGIPPTSMFNAGIDVSGLAGDNFGTSTNNNWGTFGGTGTNRPVGTFGGGSLAITGSGNNGNSFTIVADLTGFQDISVSWANRGTSTGFDSRVVEVSTNGTDFNQIFSDTGTLTSTWDVESASAGSALDDAATAFIRFTLDGATSTGGNIRIDNIVLEGTAIPEPTSLALIGLGGLLIARRRRD